MGQDNRILDELSFVTSIQHVQVSRSSSPCQGHSTAFVVAREAQAPQVTASGDD